MTYAQRTDSTQGDIVKALVKAGCAVFVIRQPCDLLVRRQGVLYLLDATGKTQYRKRSTSQLLKFSIWGVKLVKDASEALKAVGL